MKSIAAHAARRDWRALVRDPEARRFAAFLLVGGLNTLFGYAMFAGLMLIGVGLEGATIGATLLGVLFNFRSIGRIVFGSRDGRLLPRFALVYAAQAAINLGLLRLAGAWGVGPLVAEAFILPPLAVATYLAMRRFVFTDAPARPGIEDDRTP